MYHFASFDPAPVRTAFWTQHGNPRRAFWWLCAVILSFLVLKFEPVGQIQLRGAQLQGIVGSYGTPITINAVWTKDWTVTPNDVQCVQSGRIAGPVNIHFRYPTTPYGADPNVAWASSVSLTATEKANKILPLTIGGANFGQDRTNEDACGDGSPSPTEISVDAGWRTATAFQTGDSPVPNGTYTVRAEITYTNLFDPDTKLTVTAETEFDVENTIIKESNTDVVPNNPSPITWDPDPDQQATQSTTLTANFTTATKGNHQVKLSIYDINHTLVCSAQWYQVLGNGPTMATYIWDGTDNNGVAAPRGLYLFRWEAIGADHNASFGAVLNGYDSDKPAQQDFATIANGPSAELVSDDGTNAVYKVGYELSPNASAGAINVYDSTLQQIYTQPLCSDDLSANNHLVTVSMPSPQYAGTTTFLISALNGDTIADHDLGHRHRYALQCGQTSAKVNGAIAFVHGDASTHADYFTARMKALKFVQLPKYDWSYVNPILKPVSGSLMEPSLKVALYSGHGSDNASDNASFLLLKGPHQHPSVAAPATQKYLVDSTATYNGVTGLNKQECTVLDMKFPMGGTPLSRMQLVVLCGCGLGANGTGGLQQKFLNLGVQCVIAVGQDSQTTATTSLFIDGYSGTPGTTDSTGLFQGFFERLKAGTTTLVAASAAKDATQAFVD